jgi:hypothetical protein
VFKRFTTAVAAFGRTRRSGRGGSVVSASKRASASAARSGSWVSIG